MVSCAVKLYIVINLIFSLMCKLHKCTNAKVHNCKTAKLQNCKTAQMHSCHRWKPPPDSVLYNGARTPHHRPTDNKPTIFTSDSMHLLNQHWNIQTNYYVLNLFHWFTLLICLICNFEEMDTTSPCDHTIHTRPVWPEASAAFMYQCFSAYQQLYSPMSP